MVPTRSTDPEKSGLACWLPNVLRHFRRPLIAENDHRDEFDKIGHKN